MNTSLIKSREKQLNITNEHIRSAVKELMSFVCVPNNVYNTSEVNNCAAYLVDLMKRYGVESEILNNPHGNPYVFGEVLVEADLPTILFYSHFDGVPANEPEWESDPYEAIIKSKVNGQVFRIDERDDAIMGPNVAVYGRSSADSKNAIVTMLTAIALLKENGLSPSFNIKFLFDGEEENESPSLPWILNEYKDKLKADLMISASGETHQSNKATINFGERGMLLLGMEVQTASIDLHSGHFGNFMPNAALRMAKLLSTFKDDNGKVLIKDFYREVPSLTIKEKEAISTIPPVEVTLLHNFTIYKAETHDRSLQELINLPTLNIRGLQAGFTGNEARNSIPAKALCEIDIRLVDGMSPENTYQAVISHIRELGWYITTEPATDKELRQHRNVIHIKQKAAFPAVKTSLDLPVATALIAAVNRVCGDDLVVQPTDGGSLPLYMFKELGINVVALPVSNSDCNQHTANEHIVIGHFIRGIKIFTEILKIKYN